PEEAEAALAELREEPAVELLALAESFRQDGAMRHVVALLEPRVTDPLAEDLQSGAFGRMAAAVGLALMDLGESKRALALMENARGRQAGGRALLFFLAAGYERDGQYDRAEQTFRELLAADPANPQALNYLGYMLADR